MIRIILLIATTTFKLFEALTLSVLCMFPLIAPMGDSTEGIWGMIMFGTMLIIWLVLFLTFCHVLFDRK